MLNLPLKYPYFPNLFLTLIVYEGGRGVWGVGESKTRIGYHRSKKFIMYVLTFRY